MAIKRGQHVFCPPPNNDASRSADGRTTVEHAQQPRADVTKQRQLEPKELASIHNLLFSGLLQCDGSSDRSGKGRVHVATSKPPVYPKMLSPGFSICLHVAPLHVLSLSLSPPARVRHGPPPLSTRWTQSQPAAENGRCQKVWASAALGVLNRQSSPSSRKSFECERARESQKPPQRFRGPPTPATLD